MPKSIGEMNATELAAYIEDAEAKHKQRMRHCRALLRVLKDAPRGEPDEETADAGTTED